MEIPTDFAKISILTRQTRERARAGTTEAFRFVFRYAKKIKQNSTCVECICFNPLTAE